MIDPNMNNTQLINLIIASVISADNNDISEEEKQEIMKRHSKHPKEWTYIFEAIKDKRKADKLVELMEQLDTEDDNTTDPLGIFE